MTPLATPAEALCFALLTGTAVGGVFMVRDMLRYHENRNGTANARSALAALDDQLRLR